MIRQFWTSEGNQVPSVTAEQMREVDRIATDEFNLGILQMMENAGRNLTENAQDMIGQAEGEIVILAGGGGNGGGGLCCARHLHNRNYRVAVVLDRPPSELKSAAATQWKILQSTGVEFIDVYDAPTTLSRAYLVIDALIGYSLRGTPRGRTAELIALCNHKAGKVLSLDVPSGLNATTGEMHGEIVEADRILTLALPKTGLWNISGTIYLADIGIPPEVYQRLDISFPPLFKTRYWIPLYKK